MPERLLRLPNTSVRSEEVLEMHAETHASPSEDLIACKCASPRDSSLSAQIDKPSEAAIYHAR